MSPQDTLSSEGEALFRRLGVWEVVQHHGEINRTVSRGNALLDRSARANVLGLNIGTVDQLNSQAEFSSARLHATTSQTILQDLMASPDWQTLAGQVDQARPTQGYNDALDAARQHWTNRLLESDFSPDDTTGIMNTWGEVENKAKNEDYSSLFNYICDKLNQLKTVLQPAENWGRSPHPQAVSLTLAQAIALAIIIGLAIATVIACFIWAGCVWLAAIFAGIHI